MLRALPYTPGPEHFFRVGFSKRNFSRITRTLLLPEEVTPSLCPVSSPAPLPYWDSGWDDGYRTNEFFADGDIRRPSSPEQPITLTIPLRRVYAIGHRGAPYRFPENTLASFRSALDLGANGLEFDVCLTRDRRLVIFHDPSPDPRVEADGRVLDDCGGGEATVEGRGTMLDVVRRVAQVTTVPFTVGGGAVY